MMRRRCVPLTWICLLWLAAFPAACGGASCGAGARPASIRHQNLCVELATTPEQRARGLMFRSTLADDRGMLFLFPEPTRSGFWMKNTEIPLSIAFMDEQRRIVEIEDMAPRSLESVAPSRPYRFALEVNQGWFERHGVGPGDVVVVDLRNVEVR